MGKTAFLQADKANLRSAASKTPSPIIRFKDNGAPSHVLYRQHLPSSSEPNAPGKKVEGTGQGVVRKKATVHISDLQNLLLSLPCRNSLTTQCPETQ